MGKTKELNPTKIKASELETLQKFNAQTSQLTSIIADCELRKHNAISQFAEIQAEGQKFTQFLSQSYGLTQENTIDISTGEIKVVQKEEAPNEPNS